MAAPAANQWLNETLHVKRRLSVAPIVAADVVVVNCRPPRRNRLLIGKVATRSANLMSKIIHPRSRDPVETAHRVSLSSGALSASLGNFESNNNFVCCTALEAVFRGNCVDISV